LPAALDPFLVKNVQIGTDGTSATSFANVNGVLYFAANDGATGYELWESDGTSAGTKLVADINPGPGSSNPANFTNINGTLFFTADDGVHGITLWESNGNTTTEVLNGYGMPLSYPSNLTNVSGTLFFAASAGTRGVNQLWESTGNHAVAVTYINYTYGGFYPQNLTNVNGTLFFTANGGEGTALWKSDGNTLYELSYLNDAGNFTNVNGTLFFTAEYSDYGFSALWKSDGTSAGTVPLTGPISETYPYQPKNLTAVGGKLFFTAGEFGTNGRSYDNELWMSDGNTVTQITSLNTGNFYGFNPQYLTNVNGTLFFAANDGSLGYELWKSDGTTTGTTIVADINQRAGSSYPQYFTNVNGELFFSATDGSTGQELWQSNGTATGTQRIGYFGTGPYHPFTLTPVDGLLFFGASGGDGVYGLWAAPLDRSAPTSTITSPANGSSVDAVSYGGAITGTAADNLYGGGVASVNVSVTDGNGNYWNGRAFVASEEPIFTPATYGDGNWSLDLPTSALTVGTSYTVQSQATDIYGFTENPGPSITFTFAATPPPPAPTPPTITTTSLPDWTVGATYDQTIATSGGMAPVTLGITAGALPNGLSLDSNTGVISGTPTTAGTYALTITATGGDGAASSQNYTLAINSPLTIGPLDFTNPTVGSPFSDVISFSGGTGPVTVSLQSTNTAPLSVGPLAALVGSLPAGLNFNPITDTLSGTPTASGSFTFLVTVTDSIGASSSETFTLQVDPAPTPTPVPIPTPAPTAPPAPTIPTVIQPVQTVINQTVVTTAAQTPIPVSALLPVVTEIADLTREVTSVNPSVTEAAFALLTSNFSQLPDPGGARVDAAHTVGDGDHGPQAPLLNGHLDRLTSAMDAHEFSPPSPAHETRPPLGEAISGAQLRFAGREGARTGDEEGGRSDSADFEGRSFLLNSSAWQPDDNALDFERLFALRSSTGGSSDDAPVSAPAHENGCPPAEVTRVAERPSGSPLWQWLTVAGGCLTALPLLWWSRRSGWPSRRRRIQ
jgi:ELWxxDGT repeat protein